MTRDSRKGASVEGDIEDRISALPVNVKDQIFQLLPVKDAAKTSVLSTKWRYTWAMCPNLESDRLFCNTLAGVSQHAFIKTVDKMLLQHIGVILQFYLDLSGVRLSSDSDVDAWMLFVSWNSVEQLSLSMSDNNSTYKLPSCIFNCPTLTHLKLHNCSVKLPSSFVDFQNLRVLWLKDITIVDFCVVKAPVLAMLFLNNCDGTQYMNIVSPQLAALFVYDSHINLNCFTNCKRLELLQLERMVDNPKFVERSILEKLLLSLPVLKALVLGSSFLELLSAGKACKKFPFTLNLCRHLSLDVDFGKLGQTSCVLQLMKCAPILGRLDIFVTKDIAPSDNVEAVLEYLSTPTCLDHPINQLEHVVIGQFMGSKAEYLFVRLLLARTPSLIRMYIQHMSAIGSRDERNITTELMHFPKASSKAELLHMNGELFKG